MAAILDGKRFICELTSDEPGWHQSDVLVFHDGKFRSLGCDPDGYHEAAYKITNQDGALSFVATTQNDEGEQMHWSGTIQGDEIEGIAVHSLNGEIQDRYQFSGQSESGARKSTTAA